MISILISCDDSKSLLKAKLYKKTTLDPWDEV